MKRRTQAKAGQLGVVQAAGGGRHAAQTAECAGLHALSTTPNAGKAGQCALGPAPPAVTHVSFTSADYGGIPNHTYQNFLPLVLCFRERLLLFSEPSCNCALVPPPLAVGHALLMFSSHFGGLSISSMRKITCLAICVATVPLGLPCQLSGVAPA